MRKVPLQYTPLGFAVYDFCSPPSFCLFSIILFPWTVNLNLKGDEFISQITKQDNTTNKLCPKIYNTILTKTPLSQASLNIQIHFSFTRLSI